MKSLTILLFLIALSLGAWAQTTTLVTDKMEGWEKITETQANFEGDTAVMLIPGNERYRSILFRAGMAQVDLKSLVVYYENGDRQDLAIHQELKTNQNSRVLDLNGEDRLIRRIVFKYKPIAHTDDKRFRLELWGSKIIRR